MHIKNNKLIYSYLEQINWKRQRGTEEAPIWDYKPLRLRLHETNIVTQSKFAKVKLVLFAHAKHRSDYAFFVRNNYAKEG